MTKLQTSTARTDSVSQAVVETVAKAEGVDPIDLEPPLYEAIDADALDRVFDATSTRGRMDGQVRFSYNGYDVTVTGDDFVSVEKQQR